MSNDAHVSSKTVWVDISTIQFLHSCCVLKSPPLAVLPFVSGLFQTHPSVQATIQATVYSMDQDVLNESLSLTDALHDQPPTLTHMLWKIKDFAELILGDKFQNLDELWKVAIQKAIIPGTESSDLMKLGTKPEVCDSLELACTAIFCTFLPGLKRLYLDSKVTSDVNKVTVKQSSPEPSVELLEMQKEVIRLQKEVIQLKDELHNAEKSAFSTTVKKELRSYSTVLSQNCAAAVAPKRLQTALKKANAPVVSDSEDDRSKNLMIFGLPESEDEEDAATKEAAVKVFTHLEVTPTVTSSTRCFTVFAAPGFGVQSGVQ